MVSWLLRKCLREVDQIVQVFWGNNHQFSIKTYVLLYIRIDQASRCLLIPTTYEFVEKLSFLPYLYQP